jgi:exosortase/archaeosortase family protein
VKRKRFMLSKANLRRIKIVADFLIKFNLLAIPMYVIMLSGIDLYYLQVLLTDAVHAIITSLGYESVKNGIMLSFTSGQSTLTVVMDSGCTAWKSMYALAALMVASPVRNDRKKVKYIIIGVLLLFVINIARIVTTVLAGYWFGLQYLGIAHTVLWQEGMVIAVVAIWLIWLKKQKVIFREKQTILKKMLPSRCNFA